MKFRHHYLIARAAVFATLLVSAAGTAVSVANTAEQARSQPTSAALPALAARDLTQERGDRRL